MDDDSSFISVERKGAFEIFLRSGTHTDEVLDAMGSPGELLKESSTWHTRRVGPWVLKSTRTNGWRRVKDLFAPNRSARAWQAALFLSAHGVDVPAPRAFVKRRSHGLVIESVMVSDYLEGAVNVEEWARRISRRNTNEDPTVFLSLLAHAINELVDSGAYHADLSGKNILTPDGKTFYFIDLDVVNLDFPYGITERMKNHVQLYDSFCDLWAEEVLGPFIAAMTPAHVNKKPWLDQVQTGQRARRSRQMTIWRKQGKI